MIETVQVPLLMKAIDILFEEGRKFLVDRAERRKAAAQIRQQDQEPDPAVHPLPPEPDPGVKQDLLKSKIDELLWKNHEEEVNHLVRLMETYSRNYHTAKEQYAKWGSALVPPIVVHNMNEAENAMAETLQRLEAVLSKVYRQDIRPAG